MKNMFIAALFFLMPFGFAQDRYSRDDYERELRDIRERQQERQHARREAEENRRRKEQDDREKLLHDRSFSDRVNRDICRSRGYQYCD